MLTKFGKNWDSLAWNGRMSVGFVYVEIMCEAFVTGKLGVLFLIENVSGAVEEEGQSLDNVVAGKCHCPKGWRRSSLYFRWHRLLRNCFHNLQDSLPGRA